MANTDRPNGFNIEGTISGSPWQGSVRQYELDGTANGNAIAVGDLVSMTATGYLDLFQAGDAQLMGVVTGVINHGSETILGKQGDHFMSNDDPTLAGVNSKSVPASTAGTILVATAPDILLSAQEDGTTDPIELADIGQNIEIVNGGPNSITGVSTMELDSNTHATTATLPLRLVGLEQKPNNEYVSGGQAFTRWIVTPANHALSGINVGI